MMDAKPEPDLAALIATVQLCDLHQCLPEPGGLFDQDSVLMRQFLLVHAAKAERAKREYDKIKSK